MVQIHLKVTIALQHLTEKIYGLMMSTKNLQCHRPKCYYTTVSI